MARKQIEDGWRERAGLEKRRAKCQPIGNMIIINPNQMTIWDFLDEPEKPVDKLDGGGHE